MCHTGKCQYESLMDGSCNLDCVGECPIHQHNRSDTNCNIIASIAAFCIVVLSYFILRSY